MGVDPGCPHSTASYTLLTVAQLVERGTVNALQRISLGRWFESVR